MSQRTAANDLGGRACRPGHARWLEMASPSTSASARRRVSDPFAHRGGMPVPTARLGRPETDQHPDRPGTGPHPIRAGRAPVADRSGGVSGGWCGLDPMDAMTRIRLLRRSCRQVSPSAGGPPCWSVELRSWTGRRVPVSRPHRCSCMSGRAGRVRPRPGIIVDRSSLTASDVGEVDGLLVTSSVRACFDIMCRDGVEEGLVAADMAARMTGLQPDQLARYVVAHRGVAGVPKARCVHLCRSALRIRSGEPAALRLVGRGRLPRPLVNVAVVDEWGQLLGMPDLLDDDAGFVVEYDGAHHRELRQHTSDNAREESSSGPGSSWFVQRQSTSGLAARNLSGGFATATPAGWPATGKGTGGGFASERHPRSFADASLQLAGSFPAERSE